MELQEIYTHIDHTQLKQTADWASIQKLCDEAIEGGAASVCIPPCYVKQAADYVDGKIIFQGESDAVIVKGIVSLLINVLSNHTPQEILDADLYFIEKIGLKEHLSPTRSNGLVAMVKQMRMDALAFRTKEMA